MGMSEDRPKNVPPDGSRTQGTVVVLRCRNCWQYVEAKVPMVSVDAVNEERRRAEAAEGYLRACAGDQFALVSVNTLETVNDTIERLCAWIETHIPGSIVHRHNGEVIT